MLDVANHTILITGGTAGIGREIAIGLARLGGTIVVTGRRRDRGRAAVADIQARSGNQDVELMLADLSSQQEIRKLAHDFSQRHRRLNVLINNAGGLYGKRWESADGIEGTLALNHLGPFLLTHLLLPLLQAGAPSRIVNINTEGHRSSQTVNLQDFEASRWRRGFRIYSQTKLANLLFTYELARRLDPQKITVNAVHPGIVDTDLFRRFISERFFFIGGGLARAAAFVARQVAYRMMRFDSTEQAAECPIYLASSPELAGVTGKYFSCDKKMVDSSPASYDATLAKHLWDISSELVNLSVKATRA